MAVFTALTYIAIYGIGLAISASCAVGLFTLGELMEEYTVIAYRCILGLLYTMIMTYTLLWMVDGFPFINTCISIIIHLIYIRALRTFPTVNIRDYWLWIGIAGFAVNNITWYYYFLNNWRYTQIQAWTFFGPMVWLIPLLLLLSLGMEEQLPGGGSAMHAADVATRWSLVDWIRSFKHVKNAIQDVVDNASSTLGKKGIVGRRSKKKLLLSPSHNHDEDDDGMGGGGGMMRRREHNNV